MWMIAVVGLQLASSAYGEDYKEVLLWPDGAPGAKGDGERDTPRLMVYAPPAEKANGTAVVICPGGGYGHLAMGHEGHQIARWFQQRGVRAAILLYRHAPTYHHPIPLMDAKRAMRYVRHHALENGVAADRIGVMGFSAGGHLASTVGTHFDAGDPDASDPVERESSRPDFMILCYPVITLTDERYVHAGSRRNLLGDTPEAALMEQFSSEKQVTAETPPTFLFHTDADTTVPAENSILFYEALRAKKVPAELHVYRPGGHGVGLAERYPLLAGWPKVLESWMRGMGYLNKAKQ